MATILGGEHEPQLGEGEEFGTLDDLKTKNPEPSPLLEGKQESDVPQKYQGKSVTDLIQMHQEAEKLAGRQGNEVGELRKLVDDYIVNQTVAPKEPEGTVDLTDVDFIENPNASIDKKLANHPDIKQAREATKKLNKMEALNAISAAHPDFQEIVADAGFRDWVGTSQVRIKKLQKADADFDFDAADDLFSTWKERQELVQQAKAVSEADRKNSLKAGSNGNAAGSGEAPRKKFLKRSELMHMMQHEPEKYLANSDIISQAYAENRVR